MFRRRGDRRCSTRLDQFNATVIAGRFDVVRIDEVYLRGRRGQGCKVSLTNLTRNLTGDAWLWHYYPNAGDLLAVRGGVGWEPHNGHIILYVGDERAVPGVFDRVDWKTVRRALRHRTLETERRQ